MTCHAMRVSLFVWVASFSVFDIVLGNNDGYDWEIYKTTEHTPFHKRNKNNILMDVRDNHVQFAETRKSSDYTSVKLVIYIKY